jgi:uncharacterized MnhB-related membrane protein
MADLADLSENIYVAAIMVLLPLTAAMVVTQKNPYHALVIRGILGAVAALVYALFGAADVALTEALVGTMLSITLYAIAVRSSMSMRLGVLVPEVVAETGLRMPPLIQSRCLHRCCRPCDRPYANTTWVYSRCPIPPPRP